LILTMTILGLVFVISACAIGYRIIFAGSLSPILPWNIEAIKEWPTIRQGSRVCGSGRTKTFAGRIDGAEHRRILCFAQ
jgi:hypothetical protein